MIKFLSELTLADAPLYGGKGASLGELLSFGISVPNGFVISSSSDTSEKDILDAFVKLNSPIVAVRSSANIEDGGTDSFAGQFHTELSVKKEKLLTAIDVCKAELLSNRIKSYCAAKNIQQDKIRLSIIVQKMIPSDVAGVCFTMNPVSGDTNELMIEACTGLGEQLVSGKVTPDRYTVRDGKITVEYTSQEKRIVDDNSMIALVKLFKKIETHYGKPMDIEWAIEKDVIYILQARPISTTPTNKTTPHVNVEDYEYLLNWGAPYFIAAVDQETFSTSDRKPEVWGFISYGINDKVSLHISKKDRIKMSEKGLSIYLNGYEEYEKLTRIDMQIMEELSHDDATILSKDSINDLSNNFKKFMTQVYRIFENYDITESVYTDSIEQLLLDEDPQIDTKKLRANVEKMGQFKLEQRALLNLVWDYQKGPLADYLNEIKKRLNLESPPQDFHYKELLDMLAGKKIVIPDRSIWVRGKFSKCQDITGPEAEAIIRSLSYINTDCDIIKGTCSNRGLYTGTVHKIEFDIKTDYETEIANMKKGDVLVSGSTGPEMILACQKAGAIVTEEGGVISHAAIISRELGIPCITGTHIACKLLNNGDMVEVDAYNGIVKIIKRA